jgi:hypothetical protein
MLMLKGDPMAIHCRPHQSVVTRRWWRYCWMLRLKSMLKEDRRAMHYRQHVTVVIRNVVQMLLHARADVNAQGGPYGNALAAACCDGNENVM